MTLGELKNYFEKFDDNHVFNFSLSRPFSWRGAYAEVAFSLEETVSTKESNINMIEEALRDTFIGYKGGGFNYNKNTDVHFESGPSSWSDGNYVKNMLFSKLFI